MALGLALSATAGAEDLVEVYQLALENDAEYRAAILQRDAVATGVDLARSARRPTLGISVDGSDTESETYVATEAFTGFVDVEELRWDSALNARLPLYNRVNNVGVDVAKTELREAEARASTAYQNLINRTAEAYFNVLRARDQLKFSIAERDAIDRQRDQAERRYEVGLVAITDVKEAQARHDLAVANVIGAENALSQALENLRVLTGRYPESLAVLNNRFALESPLPDDAEHWVQLARDNNPLVITAREDFAASQLERDRARARRYPTVDLGATVNRRTSDVDSNDGVDTHVVSLNFQLPLYTGGQVSAATRQAMQLSQANRQALLQTEREVERQVRITFSNVKAQISQVKALHRALESNLVGLEATEAGYDAGTRTAIDVLAAIRTVTNARAQYSAARYDYVLAMLQLHSAVGLLSEKELSEYNRWLTEPK